MIGVSMNKLLTVLVAGTCAMFLAGCASSAQKASAGGYKTVTTPATELEQIKDKLANDEMIARTQAADEARAAVAEAMKTQISRYKEQYAKNVNGEAQKIWEEKANEYTQEELSGATVYKTITQFNEQDGKYKVYALIIMNPEVFKKAVMQAANSQEEFMLRAESADMQKRMDKAASAYQQQMQQQH